MFSQVKNYVNKVATAISFGTSETKTQYNISNYGRLNSALQYHRPLFLGLTKDEEKLIGNHKVRQPVVPKDPSVLPFCSGYCEVVNGGKSTLNEDCAVSFSVILDTLPKKACTANCESFKSFLDPDCDNVYKLASTSTKENPSHEHSDTAREQTSSSQGQGSCAESAGSENDASSESGDGFSSTSSNFIQKQNLSTIKTSDVNSEKSVSKTENNPSKSSKENTGSSLLVKDVCLSSDKTLRLDYFAIFDGHAGEGASLYAADVLHEILIEKIREVQHLLLVEGSTNPILPDRLLDASASKPFSTTQFHADSLIIGLLQDVMLETDKHLKADLNRFKILGGCTALLVIFILGKMFVAGAGDCRAVLCRSAPDDQEAELERKVVGVPMSQDFTPATERRRLQYLAYIQPSLLSEHFSRLEFVRRLTSMDVGKKVLYRDYHMTGWVYKEVTPADLRHPMISGFGKSRRLLATIGVTRGLGDHNLLALNQLHDVPIKPFLSAVPEVRVYDLASKHHGPNDVLIMGSDGLWDVLTNDEAAQQVTACLEKLDESNSQRFCIAAQDLVLTARGHFIDGTWRKDGSKLASVDDITVFVIPLLGASRKHC